MHNYRRIGKGGIFTLKQKAPAEKASAAVCRKTSIVDKNGVAGAEPPTGTRGGSPSNIAPARMPGVYAQGLCTMQSQPSIHSLSPRERGLGIGIINQKFISKTDFFSKLNLYIYNNRKSYAIQPFCVYCTNYYFKSRE